MYCRDNIPCHWGKVETELDPYESDLKTATIYIFWILWKENFLPYFS